MPFSRASRFGGGSLCPLAHIKVRREQRAAIVTGGGRGIGRKITLRLLRDSAVVVVGRSAADLVAVCAAGHRAGGQALPCIGDVADPATAAAVIDLVRSRGWALGHLVCNAGLGKAGPTAGFDPAVWRG